MHDECLERMLFNEMCQRCQQEVQEVELRPIIDIAIERGIGPEEATVGHGDKVLNRAVSDEIKNQRQKDWESRGGKR